MKVAIIGGHGQIGLRLARILAERGDEVRSIVRKREQFEDVAATGAEPVLCDLESASAAELAEAIGKVNAVVFAAGAGPGSGPERKETVDYGGAVKLIEAAKKNKIRRYIQISSTGANASVDGDDTFSVYLRAKGRADNALVHSGLDYTILRPPRLTNEPGEGAIKIDWRPLRGFIARDDVAAVIAAILQAKATVGKVLWVTHGNRSVEEAIKNL